MKKEIKIVIVGGYGRLGKLIMHSLKQHYSDVCYFQNEAECQKNLFLKPDILILDDNLKMRKPLEYLKSVKSETKAYVIYLSRDTHFMNIKRAINSGAIDFIVKDSYTSYAINKSIERILNLTDNLKRKVKYSEYFKSSNIKKRFPYRFRLLQMLM